MAKKKTPKIDPRLLVRPRLDALFDRHARGELDQESLPSSLQQLLVEVGYRPLLEALLKRLEAAPAADRERFWPMAARLRTPEVIAHLWQKAREAQAAVETRRLSLSLLRALGEDADPDHPERYVPAPAPRGWPIPLSTSPRPSERSAADERWEQFEAAPLSEKIRLFESAVNSGALDDFDEAFEMLNAIRDRLDPRRNPANRPRYAQLVEQLQQMAPALYRHSVGYYLENLIEDALDDDDWQALPELLIRFAADAADDVDTFYRLQGALLYYGQTRPMLAAMRLMQPQVATSPKLIPGAGDEFAGNALLWAFYDYVDASATPRADDPALSALEAEWGEFNREWVQRAIKHLTTTTAWTPADFGDGVDAEQWEDNLAGLLFEFMAEQRARGVPFSKLALARDLWYDVLHTQMTAGQPPSRSTQKKGKKKTAQRVPAAPLVPERRELDRTCAERMDFLSPEPYLIATTLELLPDYLQFIARRGLLARPDLESALSTLKPLAKQVELLLTNFGGDPRLPANVAAAWEAARLAEFSHDPALPEVIAAPPPAPSLPEPLPGAHLTYTFKVTYQRNPDIWRTVELTSTQTLRELHVIIQEAFDFDFDHLYSFFLSGRAWDKNSEYAAQPQAHERGVGVTLGSLRLRPKQRLLYLFDYGDEHRFEVQLVGLNPDAPKGRYPRLVEAHGQSPPQYGEWEADEAWNEDDSDETDDDDDHE
jgi:hypothetical protein